MTKIILMIVEKAIYAYVILLGIRIVFSWFKPVIDGTSSKNVNKLWHYLCFVTGPYLAFFGRFKKFRSNTFDFSPLVGIYALLVVNQVIGLFELVTRISLNVIVFILILGIWEALRLILFFFLFLCVVRLAGIFFREVRLGRFLNIIDLAIQPFTLFILRVGNKNMKYQTILFMCIGIIAVVCIAGNFSFQPLYRLIVGA
jgi:hypothetical protein